MDDMVSEVDMFTDIVQVFQVGLDPPTRTTTQLLSSLLGFGIDTGDSYEGVELVGQLPVTGDCLRMIKGATLGALRGRTICWRLGYRLRLRLRVVEAEVEFSG